MSASNKASRPRVENADLVTARRRLLQHFRKPFRHQVIHFLGGELGGGMAGLGWGALGRAFEHAQHQLAEQGLVADTEGVEVILHLFVGGIPFLQRPSRQLAGGIRQGSDAVHGGLHWYVHVSLKRLVPFCNVQRRSTGSELPGLGCIFKMTRQVPPSGLRRT